MSRFVAPYGLIGSKVAPPVLPEGGLMQPLFVSPGGLLPFVRPLRAEIAAGRPRFTGFTVGQRCCEANRRPKVHERIPACFVPGRVEVVRRNSTNAAV